MRRVPPSVRLKEEITVLLQGLGPATLCQLQERRAAIASTREEAVA